jgi:hypothetical protein
MLELTASLRLRVYLPECRNHTHDYAATSWVDAAKILNANAGTLLLRYLNLAVTLQTVGAISLIVLARMSR